MYYKSRSVDCVTGITEMIARLRVPLIEPEAQGLRLGKQLVQRCIEFPREKGYKTLVLPQVISTRQPDSQCYRRRAMGVLLPRNLNRNCGE